MHPLHDAVAALIREVAAEVILPRFRALANDQVEEKTPGDFVTIADRESEERLAAGLAQIASDARIVGEEASAADPSLIERLDEDRIWLIDPVDGTNNFASGRTPFGVMIALLDGGEVEAGWLYDPVAGRMCHAARGGGAFINGVQVATRGSGRPLPVAALATYFMTPEQRADLARRAPGKLELVDIPRCAAEQYPRLVLGQNDVALFERSHPWDHAPGSLLLTEAGGVIRRPDGSAYRIGDGRRGLLAAGSPALWDEAAAILFG